MRTGRGSSQRPDPRTSPGPRRVQRVYAKRGPSRPIPATSTWEATLRRALTLGLATATTLALTAGAGQAQTLDRSNPVVMSVVTLHADSEELAEAFQLVSRSLVLLNRDGVILPVRPTRHPSDYEGCAETLPDPHDPGADFGCLRGVLETAHGQGEDLVVVLGTGTAAGGHALACVARGGTRVERVEVDLTAAVREGEEGSEARARLGACLVGATR